MDVSILDIMLEEDILDVQNEKQRKILEASIELIAEKGFANTSTAEIAKRAGVSVGTLFNYYKTKETLLLAIVLPAMNNIILKMMSENDHRLMLQLSSNFEEFIRLLITSRVMLLEKNRALLQVIIKEVLYKEELKAGLLDNFSIHALPFLNDAIEHFKEIGELKDLPTERIIKYILINLAGLCISSVLNPNSKPISEREVNDLVTIVLDGLRNNEPKDHL